jgi:hypothetical protein
MAPLRRDDAVGVLAWHNPWVDGSLLLRGASADLADNYFRRFSLKMGCMSSLQRNANKMQTKCKLISGVQSLIFCYICRHSDERV